MNMNLASDLALEHVRPGTEPGAEPVGALALVHCNKALPLTVLRSAAGFYIGTADEDGPCSHESAQYWTLQDKAERALATGLWTQRPQP